MSKFRVTPSQTVGPFFAYGLTARQYGYDYSSLIQDQLVHTSANAPGNITISGQVFDGAGNLIPDAMIELWQTAPKGQTRTATVEYPAQSDSFTGIGRLGTGTQIGNRFEFTTLKPNATGPDSAPHITVILFMRGSLRTLHTRLYFADEADANAQDALLNLISADRRATLIAQKIGDGQYQFDIRMQGEGETVFFDL